MSIEDENTDVFIYQKQDSNETQYMPVDKFRMEAYEAAKTLNENQLTETEVGVDTGITNTCLLKSLNDSYAEHIVKVKITNVLQNL